jgi:hypothetical protein
MTCTIGHFNWQKMHIVLPLTSIKADGKTRMEFKGVHSQLESLTPKIVCIELPEAKKMYYFLKGDLGLRLDDLSGYRGLFPRNRNLDCGSTTAGKTGFYLVTVEKTFR